MRTIRSRRPRLTAAEKADRRVLEAAGILGVLAAAVVGYGEGDVDPILHAMNEVAEQLGKWSDGQPAADPLARRAVQAVARLQDAIEAAAAYEQADAGERDRVARDILDQLDS